MLRQLAVAQAQAGAVAGSYVSAAGIGQDRLRATAFSEVGAAAGQGAAGGAAMADFDSLIDLIQNTLAPDSWADAGGAGAIEPFPGGVYVDAAGTLKRVVHTTDRHGLAVLRKAALPAGGNGDVRSASVLRKVSLTRLERQIQSLLAQGKQPDEAMRVLAGLTKVQYIFLYPETRDIVIAGPAEDWAKDADGRAVGVTSGRPALRLDDLVVVLRNALSADGRFTCAITPDREKLADVQAFLNESGKKSLRPGKRDEWLAELRTKLGDQRITVEGLDPRTHAARVLVEADYHMKLVGMGLEPGVLGVRSYLDSIEIPPGGSPPPMEVLRWWFTLNYDLVKATEDHLAFELVGPGVKVLSENEFLTERGERVHTGDSGNLNRQFAQSFTRHFEQLAVKYPVYAELRNVFDLALVAGVVRAEDALSRCDWEPTAWGTQGEFRVELGRAPTRVPSIINHREVDRKHLLVGVSGGVLVDTQTFLRGSSGERRIRTDSYGLIKAERGSSAAPALPHTAWWWD